MHELEFEYSDHLRTFLGDHGWMVEGECPNCNRAFSKFYDLISLGNLQKSIDAIKA